MQVSQFNAPLPGSSLALNKLGERPFERPPELNTVEEALEYYFKSFSNDEVIDDIMTVLDMGVAINPVVKTMYMTQVMNGKHNLDVGLLVAPVLSEFLASVAKSYGIDYKFSNIDPKEQKEEKDHRKLHMMYRAAIAKGVEAEGEADKGVQLLQEMSETLEQQEEVEDIEDIEELPPEAEDLQGTEGMNPEEGEPMPPQAQGAGLMSRGGM
jgi:NAD(P)H-dependent FMN reductase